MHQPDYRNPETGSSSMPWVRLHALKGYFDMLHVLERSHDDARATFNFVPSLLEQMQSYLNGTLTDEYLEVSRRPVEELDDSERLFICREFFHANHRTMIDCYPRYRQLRMLTRLPGTAAHSLKDDELRDLVVWFNLTWMGYTARREYPLVDELIRQGSHYTEEQKLALLDLHMEIMGRIVSDYRQRLQSGIIDITTTPFFHPILPLLCDTDSAQPGMPKRELPSPPFQASEDARYHVSEAVRFHEKAFGRKPQGMWPAEGSVSPEAVEIFAENGITWLATDQDILYRSLPKTDSTTLFQPYLVGNTGAHVNMVFRERDLADGIGFRYSTMRTDAAVADFMSKLNGIRKGLPRDMTAPLITIVLDGENAWEYYPDGGESFLTAMYRDVCESPDFNWTTVSDYLDTYPAQKTIKRIFPGSWIGGNFDIWIGSSEENKGWDLLRDARQILTASEQNVSEEVRQTAWRHLYSAEGSDWFWWYGNDFNTPLQPEFDKLFRAHVAQIYRLLDKPVPGDVIKPIKTGRKPSGTPPIDLISPVIDGRVTDYYEWVGAGELNARSSDGSMARGTRVIDRILYGADHKNLYIRIDMEESYKNGAHDPVHLRIDFVSPGTASLQLGPLSLEPETIETVFRQGTTRFKGRAQCKYEAVLECSLPLITAGFAPGTECEFVVVVEIDAEEIERWPRDGLLSMDVPSDTYELEHWSV